MRTKPSLRTTSVIVGAVVAALTAVLLVVNIGDDTVRASDTDQLSDRSEPDDEGADNAGDETSGGNRATSDDDDDGSDSEGDGDGSTSGGSDRDGGRAGGGDGGTNAEPTFVRLDLDDEPMFRNRRLQVVAFDSDGSIESIVVDWGDGSPTVTVTGPQLPEADLVHHYPSELGPLSTSVSVTAYDNEGAFVNERIDVDVHETMVDLTVEWEGTCILVPGGGPGGSDVLNVDFLLRDVGPEPHAGRVQVELSSPTSLSEPMVAMWTPNDDRPTQAQLQLDARHYGRIHILTLVSDPAGQIAEGNESNNSVSITIDLDDRPNEVSSAGCSPA